MNSVSIIDCGKATNIKYHAQQYINSELKVICLYDSDTDGKRASKNNTYIKDRFKLFISDTHNRTIEDILPKEIFKKAYQYVCLKHKDILKKFNDINMPYMKTFDRSFKLNLKKEKKSIIKHELEDKMMEFVKKQFDADTFKEIEIRLRKIKKVLE